MKTDSSYDRKLRDRVIITAAVRALFGRSAAIRRIKAVRGSREGAWMREGRLAIHRSHRMAAPLIRLAPDRGTGNV